MNNISLWVLSILRIAIGWHLLYEGFVKLTGSGWTSAGYLLESRWLFAGLFHWIAAHPGVLQVVDILNIWGLILIGLGLMIGVLARYASMGGIALLALYYIANPPFIGYLSETTGEGHYLIVNKQLIEMGVLIMFVFLPRSFFWSLDRLLSRNIEYAVSHK